MYIAAIQKQTLLKEVLDNYFIHCFYVFNAVLTTGLTTTPITDTGDELYCLNNLEMSSFLYMCRKFFSVVYSCLCGHNSFAVSYSHHSDCLCYIS